MKRRPYLDETTLSSKFQCVVPKTIRNILDIDVGDKLLWNINNKNEIILTVKKDNK